MTTNATTKAQPKWKVWLRRQLRPRPYWQKRLDDQVEQPHSFWSELWGWVNRLVSLWFLLVLMATFLSLYISAVVVPVFFSPGFFEYGLADPLGRLYASACLSAGYCDLRYLLAGSAIGVLVLVAMGLPIFHNFAAPDDADEVTETELLDYVSAVDERIVQLRADFVIAGLLKVRPEESAEVEDVPTLPAPEAAPIAYQRPELNRVHQSAAGQLAIELTGNKSMVQIRAAVALVLLENQRLLLETNEHRAARGLEPLPTFEAK